MKQISMRKLSPQTDRYFYSKVKRHVVTHEARYPIYESDLKHTYVEVSEESEREIRFEPIYEQGKEIR